MDLLTNKIIEQVYGRSIQHYKDYLKVEAQKAITILQERKERENKERELEDKRGLPFIPETTTWIELVQYESLLNNIDSWNILDINIDRYELFDFKTKKIHNTFIDKMIDEIANKLIKGESII